MSTSKGQTEITNSRDGMSEVGSSPNRKISNVDHIVLLPNITTILGYPMREKKMNGKFE